MFIFAIIAIILLIVMRSVFKLHREEFKKTGKHPKGHFMGQGIAIGLPIGVAVGVATGNMGVGPAIGIAIGVAIGAGMEKKNQDKIRPLTEKEIELKKKSAIISSVLLIVGIGALIVVFLVAK
ncbi:hypothetical protein C0583_02750 [Candidatus Parcubacteria bacterium]|nr:MAG: hypothetical protein C0583_02750 [Candidatus Parcubacteria bacterium]